jgi:hypothetical protein
MTALELMAIKRIEGIIVETEELRSEIRRVDESETQVYYPLYTAIGMKLEKAKEWTSALVETTKD